MREEGARTKLAGGVPRAWLIGRLKQNGVFGERCDDAGNLKSCLMLEMDNAKNDGEAVTEICASCTHLCSQAEAS